jgi:hypothetical protein
MKLKFYLVIFLITNFSIQNAFSAQDKILIMSTPESDRYILNKTIKKISPNIRQYWEYEIFKEDIEIGGSILYSQNEYTKALRKINCKEDTTIIIDIVTYNENGTFKGKSTNPEPGTTKWDAVVPGSIGSKTQSYICSKQL